ncbi:hypothetical protein GIB67_030232 [Kingdonia uniflora]|uniref:RRM domain-containing protein n=1 Tax=Kingdonia uniflora TaxID=39325 RepID=A0A7J7MMQ8_9MAGN|nr:hypothetical protein GIB67_030232 [Kingdonia uniflora]
MEDSPVQSPKSSGPPPIKDGTGSTIGFHGEVVDFAGCAKGKKPGFQTVAIFMQNGVQEKSMAAVDKISDIVENSPHKIFIGGISEALSSNMLMEIASAFGILRAYRFQFYKEINGSCAFLEYIDHSITYIACAGLNGMKLGGKVLTVLQAFPDESPQENAEKAPFYGIPEYAKPLLSEPTNVLKLENALNQEKLSSLSESELEEILEDIRLECSRFGTVKSVNIVRYESGVIVPETCEISCQTDMRSSLHDPESTVCTERIKTAEEADNETQENSRQEVIEGIKFSLEECGNAEDCRGSIVDKPDDDLSKNEMSETPQLGSIEVEVEQLDPKMDAKESSTQIDANKSKSNNGSNDIESSSIVEEPKQDDATVELQEKPRSVRRESDASSNDESKEKISSFDNIFEQGCIFVEYVRAEASCAAAHCLHRRLYGERVVVVDYVPHDLYLSKFPK